MDAHEKLDYNNTGMEYNINKNGEPVLEFKNQYIQVEVKYNSQKDVFIVRGHVKKCKNIKYLAATPLWRNCSYSGSGLPFPNHFVAYENTPNNGIVQTHNDIFEIQLAHPSGYYVNQGKTLLKPHVHLELVELNIVMTLVIGDYLPFRSLKNLPNHPNRTIGR